MSDSLRDKAARDLYAFKPEVCEEQNGFFTRRWSISFDEAKERNTKRYQDCVYDAETVLTAIESDIREDERRKALEEAAEILEEQAEYQSKAVNEGGVDMHCHLHAMRVLRTMRDFLRALREQRK